MTPEQFTELLAAAKRLADAGDGIVQALAIFAREEKDPATHAMLTRLLHTARDASASINFALRDAPAARAAA